MKKIITISREFGSGGRSIGKAVAEKLGFQYCDKEIIEKISEETGLSKEFIAENGEYAPRRGTFGYASVGRAINGMSMEDCLNVFIHADTEFKVNRILNKYGETNENPGKRLIDKDKKRAANYKYYTEQKWGASKNYDISLKSSELGLETCEDIIVQLAKAL